MKFLRKNKFVPWKKRGTEKKPSGKSSVPSVLIIQAEMSLIRLWLKRSFELFNF